MTHDRILERLRAIDPVGADHASAPPDSLWPRLLTAVLAEDQPHAPAPRRRRSHRRLIVAAVVVALVVGAVAVGATLGGRVQDFVNGDQDVVTPLGQIDIARGVTPAMARAGVSSRVGADDFEDLGVREDPTTLPAGHLLMRCDLGSGDRGSRCRDLRDGRPTTATDAITVPGGARWFRLEGARPASPGRPATVVCIPERDAVLDLGAGVAVGTTMAIPPTSPIRDPQASVEAKVKALRSAQAAAAAGVPPTCD